MSTSTSLLTEVAPYEIWTPELAAMRSTFDEDAANKPGIHDATGEVFAQSTLPLYAGPFVRFKAGHKGREHKVSKALLVRQSECYANQFMVCPDQEIFCFEGVSEQCLGYLIQYLYIGRVYWEQSSVSDRLDAIIGFVTLASHQGVHGMEEQAANEIRQIITRPRPLQDLGFIEVRTAGYNSKDISEVQMHAMIHLPRGHPIRRLAVKASVEGYMLGKGQHKYLALAEKIPEYNTELLKAVLETFKTAYPDPDSPDGQKRFFFTDPVKGDQLCLDPLQLKFMRDLLHLFNTMCKPHRNTWHSKHASRRQPFFHARELLIC